MHEMDHHNAVLLQLGCADTIPQKTNANDAATTTECDQSRSQPEDKPHKEPSLESDGAHMIRSIKRKANPDNWKQTVRKRLRQSGKEYVSASGKVMAERMVRPGCGATCHLKCGDRLSEDQRLAIHNAFWRLTDDQKNNFYWKYTSRTEPKRRRNANITSSKRAHTFQYKFEVGGEILPVCSKFFFMTLDITSRRIYYFYEHCYQPDTCMPREIRRGKNQKPTLPDLGKRLDQIRQHIATFPSVRLNGRSQKRYLAGDLSLRRMYKMYAESTCNPLKMHWYCKVFNEEYNLGFRLPKSPRKSTPPVAISSVATLISSASAVQEENIIDTPLTPPVQGSVISVATPQVHNWSLPTAVAPSEQWTACLQAEWTDN